MFPIAIGSNAVLRKSYRLLAPDETVVTLIKTGSSGAFSLYVHFPRVALRLPGAIVVLPLWGNYFCTLFSLLSFFSFSPITHYSYYLSLLFTIHHLKFNIGYSLLLVPASYHTNHLNLNLFFPDPARSFRRWQVFPQPNTIRLY